MSAGTEAGPARRLLAAVLLGAALAPAPLAGQGFLEQFSYEGLRFQGMGLELGPVVSDRLTREASPALRLDYGFIAPRVRVLLGGSYYRGSFNAEEIRKFEEGLRRVVADPTGDFGIDVGRITWSDVEADLDLQYLVPGHRFLPYVGLGLGVHVRNGTGVAIDGTFVEDALDTIAAGVNLSVGVQVVLASRLHLVADLRGGLTSELRTASARAGLMYRVPQGTSR